MAIWTKGGDTTFYELVLAKANGKQLADLRPPDLGHHYDLLPLHWYSRLEVTDSTVTFQSLDDGWVETYVRQHPREIAHLVVDGSIIFSAAPRALQDFMRRHWEEEGAWSDVVKLGRARPQE